MTKFYRSVLLLLANSLLLLCLATTVSFKGWTREPEMLYGVTMHPTQDVYAPDTTLNMQVKLAQSLGIDVISIDIHWAWIEITDTEPAAWNPTQLNRIDRFLDQVDDTPVTVMALVTESPCWASADPLKQCGCSTPPCYDATYPPSDPADFAAFLTDFVALYGDRITHWMIWGEPNSPFQWRNPNAADYVALLKKAYPAIKAVKSDATVLAAGLAPWDGNEQTPSVFEYVDQMYAFGAADYFDRLAYNPYTDGNSPTWYNSTYPAVSFNHSIPAIRSIMVTHGDTRPMWISEVGWSTVSDECVDCWVGTLPTSESEQAEYLLQASQIAQSWGYVEAFIPYELVDMVAPWDSQERLEYYYGLFEKDFGEKPAAIAYRNLLLPFKISLPFVAVR